MSVTSLFAVYGTLRERGGAGRAIKNLGGEFIESGILSGYEMWERNWIPYITESQPGHDSIVIVDVVSFPDALVRRALYALDEYEGYREGHEPFCSYHRKLVNVQTENTSLKLAYCYVANEYMVRPYQDFGFNKVDSGDYVSYTTTTGG